MLALAIDPRPPAITIVATGLPLKIEAPARSLEGYSVLDSASLSIGTSCAKSRPKRVMFPKQNWENIA